jgi:hypothetical protein
LETADETGCNVGRVNDGTTAHAPPFDGSTMSSERVPVTIVGRRQRSVRDPSDGSVDTLRLVRVRYANGREKEWVEEAVTTQLE